MISKAKKIYKLLNIIQNYYYLRSLLLGVAASIEHKQQLVQNRFNTLIDIGANKGQFALIARYYNPKAKIYSFEPLEKPTKLFNKIFKSDQNIILHNAAVGPVKKKIKMHVSKRIDSSSLLPIGENQSFLFPGTEESHKEGIYVAPLDHFINNEDLKSPIFVKIDVQGYELEVLKGSKSLIDEFDYIYVECSFVELYEGQALADEVIHYLQNYSFRLKGIYNIYYDKKGVAVQGDFLFSKD